MKNQMEKKLEDEMETGVVMGYVGVILGHRRTGLTSFSTGPNIQ